MELKASSINIQQQQQRYTKFVNSRKTVSTCILQVATYIWLHVYQKKKKMAPLPWTNIVVTSNFEIPKSPLGNRNI